MKVLSVLREVLMMFTSFFPCHTSRKWTMTPNMLWNFQEEDREEEGALVFVHTRPPWCIVWSSSDRRGFLPFSEPVVPHLPFSGSCFVFLSICFYVLIISLFGSPFSCSHRKIKLSTVLWWKESALSFVCAIWRVKAGEDVASAPSAVPISCQSSQSPTHIVYHLQFYASIVLSFILIVLYVWWTNFS